jgi:hypothetical protein
MPTAWSMRSFHPARTKPTEVANEAGMDLG